MSKKKQMDFEIYKNWLNMLKKSHLNKNYVIFEKSNYSQPYISNKYLN